MTLTMRTDSANPRTLKLGVDAAGWLVRILDPDAADDPEEPIADRKARIAAWLAWMRESPEHVNAFMDTLEVHRRLHLIDPQQAIEVQGLLTARTAEVIPLHGTAGSNGLLPPAVIQAIFDDRDPAESSHEHDDLPPRVDWEAEISRTHRRRAFWALAAALVLATFGTVFYPFNPFSARIYATAVGEQRTCKLEDGSVVVLNTDTSVQVDYSRHARNIRLLRGEALFIVEHNTERPFIVTAGAATVRAVGTEFNVRRRSDSTEVDVVEGVVQVAATQSESAAGAPQSPTENSRADDQPGSNVGHPSRNNAASTQTLSPGMKGHSGSAGGTLRLSAGEQAQVAEGNVTKSDTPAGSDVLSWRQRRLVFRDAPLSEVAAEFNRYNRVQVRVEGDVARSKQLTGIFDADRPQSIILFATKDETLTVQPDGDNWVIKAR